MSNCVISQAESKLLNEVLFEKLASDDPFLRKEAVDAVNDFTRLKMRENGFFRQIMPPLPLSNDELDRHWHTDKAIKVCEMEPDSPAAMSVPLGTLPMNYYIRGRRYLVMFERIETPRFTKDVDELRTYEMDIRSVFSDNAIKDIATEEDTKFITAVNTMLLGQGVTMPSSGIAQYVAIAGGITRDNLVESLKTMPSTPFSLEVHTRLANHITIKDVMKFDRNEAGGDFSESMLKNGYSEETLLGTRWIITIKKSLVPTNHVFSFADPKFLGKHFQLEDTTMYIRREAFMLEFFAYQLSGATLAHPGGLARHNFT